MIIYLDMDEVVADWFAAAGKILNKTWDHYIERVEPEDWEVLRQHPRIYRDLPLKPNARDLVHWVLNYAGRNSGVEVRFLTAVPKGNDMPWAFQDKIDWVRHYFPGIPVHFGPYSADKYKHCQPGDILIDDRKSNYDAWIEAGGRAHMYRNWPDCKEWLENTLKSE